MENSSQQPSNEKRKQWQWRGYTLLDAVLLFLGISAVIATSIIFNAPWLVIVNSFLGIFTVFLQAKGKIATFFIGIVWFAFYAVMAYQQSYYGETILYITIMIPFNIYGIVHWLKSRNEKDNIAIIRGNLNRKEWLVFTALLLTISIGVFFLLRALNTAELWLSTIAFCSLLPPVYLLVRRSKWNQVMFVISDLIVFALWLVLVLRGNLEFIAHLCFQAVQLTYDIYGVFEWWRMEKEQKALSAD